MIKKFLHYLCLIAFGSAWSVALALVFQQILLLTFHINPLSLRTYEMFADYWNNGGVIVKKDCAMLGIMFIYFPICFFGWYKLNKKKFINIIIIPLEKISNWSIRNYKNGMPNVNIKNLKIEEKKTLEQVVGERLEAEKKKAPKVDSAAFRKDIISKIETEIK